jgi:hypothetical protein
MGGGCQSTPVQKNMALSDIYRVEKQYENPESPQANINLETPQ